MSKQANPTPGDWCLESSTEDYQGQFIISGTRVIAMTHTEHPVKETGEERANAKLLCAAPTMLEALRAVVHSGPLNNGLRDENTLTLAREAIITATK
jgi:hypothetical protein